MNISINFDEIFGIVSRSLSIIGKSAVDDNGNLLFKDITLGSNEKQIVNDFMGDAANMLAAELSGYVTGSSGGVTVTYPSNHNSNLDTFIQKSGVAFCKAYILYSWFVITAPKIADKYQGDMTSQLASIVRMSTEKNAPTGSTDILNTSTSVA